MAQAEMQNSTKRGDKWSTAQVSCFSILCCSNAYIAVAKGKQLYEPTHPSRLYQPTSQPFENSSQGATNLHPKVKTLLLGCLYMDKESRGTKLQDRDASPGQLPEASMPPGLTQPYSHSPDWLGYKFSALSNRING